MPATVACLYYASQQGRRRREIVVDRDWKDLARYVGEDVNESRCIAGLKVWF